MDTRALPTVNTNVVSIGTNYSTTTPITPSTPKLASFGAANSLLSNKVQSTISTASNLSDNEPLRTALHYVGTFYDLANTPEQRQELQGNLERKALETHEMLLSEFVKVSDQLTQLDVVVSELNSTCNLIEQRLQKNREQSRHFLSQIKALNTSIQETEARQMQLKQFLEQFQLAEEEKNIILTGRVDASFFATLKKVHDIHTRCLEMLRNEQHKASIEVLDEMSGYKDLAYERLSRWTQQQCKYLSGTGSESQYGALYDNDDNIITDDPEEMELIVEAELRQAFDALVERPALLKCCTDQFTEDRSASLVKRFLEALMKGGSNRAARPIEMQAHDPIRYVGDILAWIHQSVAVEVELIHSILGFSGNSEPRVRRNSTERSGPKAKDKLAFEILDRIFSSLVPHLKFRVQQVLNSSNRESLVIYFRLAHLLELYSFTIGKMLGESSSFPIYLIELKNQSMNKFFYVLEKNISSITVADLSISNDLTPPEVIKDMMDKLKEIMNTYSKSVIPEDRREEDFSNVLSSVTDPLLNKLSDYFEANKERKDKLSDLHIFLINCYLLIQNSLGNYTFTSKKLEQVFNLMESHVNLFVDYQAQSLLETCGLREKVNLIKAHSKANVPLSQVPGLTREELVNFFLHFNENLYALGSQLLIPQKQCYLIASARLRIHTQNRIATEFSSAYTLLYQTVHDAQNFYADPHEFAYHSPEKVITILE